MTTPPGWSPIDDRFPRLHWRLDEAAWEAFGRFGTEHAVAPEEVVFDEGTPSISLFLVVDGEVSISRGGREIGRVGSNFSFGEMGLLLDQARGGRVTATRPTRLLELSRADLGLMQEQEPIWSTRLYRVLAECLAEYLQSAAKGKTEGGAS